MIEPVPFADPFNGKGRLIGCAAFRRVEVGARHRNPLHVLAKEKLGAFRLDAGQRSEVPAGVVLRVYEPGPGIFCGEACFLQPGKIVGPLLYHVEKFDPPTHASSSARKMGFLDHDPLEPIIVG